MSAGPITIDHDAGIDAVYDLTLSSQDNLTISGGSLSVLSTSTLAGSVQNMPS